ncbi:MAG: quinolinate synthase NadA [bacterium]|nr:quinolinate synthase NadA [bacterium]
MPEEFKDDAYYIEKINQLRKERNAVILAHNYQRPEIQDIADLAGDSLDLSRRAAKTDADVVVFCGVRFMAETAAIVSPQKKVLLPAKEADCPMVRAVSRQAVIEMKRQHPGATTVCYVNTSAEVKAEADICCTSANVVKVVASLGDEEILFIPDKHLGAYAAHKTGKNICSWDGFCPTHFLLSPEDVKHQMEKYPEAEVLVHPECRFEVIELAHQALSTNGMVTYVKESSAKEFIIGTENGLIYRLAKENPDKKFYPASESMICPNMKLTTLERVAHSLETMEYEIVIPDEVRQPAQEALNRMLAVT